MRKILWAALAVAGLPVHAEVSYPTHTVRIIAPYTAGAPADIQMRAMSESLSKRIGQTIIFEHKSGAAGALAAAAALQAPADGYTLLVVTAGMLEPNDQIPLESLRLVAGVASNPMVLVVADSSPYRTLKELLDVTSLKYAVNNQQGSIGKVATECLRSLTGFSGLAIPYRGDPVALLDLIRGEFDFMFAHGPTVVGHLQAGKLRALAVAGNERSVFLPDVPTVVEAGVSGFAVRSAMTGIAVAKDTPRAITDYLMKLLSELPLQNDLKDKLAKLWIEPVFISEQKFEEQKKMFSSQSSSNPCLPR